VRIPVVRVRGMQRWLALAVALALVAAGLAWTQRHELRLLFAAGPGAAPPAFLDPADATVTAARRGADDQLAVLAQVRDGMHAAMPALADLWDTRTRYGVEPANVQLWTRDHSVAFRGYPAFRVRRDPTWSENPYRNISWEADYQSLAWLRSPEAAYEQTKDASYLYQVKAYVLDWIADANAVPPPSDRTWYDDAVSIRTDVLVGLLRGDLWNALGTQQLAAVLGSLEQHGTLLDGYLHDRQFIGHNHNLFHALSLYNLAVAFPQLTNAAAWRADARARLASLLPELVDAREGVSTEGAAAYHYVVLQTYANAEAFLERHHDALPDADLAILRAMDAFGAVLLSPTGETPPIGDTPYASKADLEVLEALDAQGLTTDTTAFVLSHGQSGARPPDAWFAPNAGYAVIRPTWGVGAAWADDVQVVVDTSDVHRSHGHDDAMTFVLNGGGGPLLVDSGGPYVYGQRSHLGFVAAAAHNTIVDLGRTGGRGPVSDLVEQDSPGLSVVSGSVAISDTATDRRAIVVIKPDLVLVVDQLSATDAAPHDFALYYHLPPGGLITPLAGAIPQTSGTVVAGPAALGYAIAGSAPIAASLIVGQDQPFLGWVTPAYNERLAAPVLAFRTTQTSGWYVAAFQPGAGAVAIPKLSVTADGAGGLRVEVMSGATQARLVVNATGAVTFVPPIGSAVP
jgi:hypothetical protein